LASYENVRPLTYSTRNVGGAPVYTLNATSMADFDNKAKWVNSLSTGSTWGMQFGIRLLF
jgi:hypothetical protein